jgi:hypothetical protein
VRICLTHRRLPVISTAVEPGVRHISLVLVLQTQVESIHVIIIENAIIVRDEIMNHGIMVGMIVDNWPLLHVTCLELCATTLRANRSLH